ncbi:MAG: DNA polymerase III subunit alpha, partial [Chloroflexota bacterium]
MVDLANTLGLGCVATNNAHYHIEERASLQDVLVAIRHRTTLQASHRYRRANSEFYLKTPAQMAALFRDLPAALRNTLTVAERCDFTLCRDVPYQFPQFRLPNDFVEPTRTYFAHAVERIRAQGTSKDEHSDAFLEALCRTAMERKYPLSHPDRKAAELRLAEELRLIGKHGLSGFFLAYCDILDIAGGIAERLRKREPGLPPDVRPIARGRGSSVASIVCYLIGLSHIDPLANKLGLERFMNDDLASIPDIDLDLPRDIRADLLAGIWTAFDTDRAALVCSFATYRTRSAIRDIGKALDLPAAEIDKLAKMSELWGSNSVAEEMKHAPEFASRTEAPIWRDLIQLASELMGMPRHIGQHVGGIVLSKDSLKSSVPIVPAWWAGRYVIQWDKDSVDDARMVKIDLLGLGMLSLVEDCLSLIEARRGTAPDLGRIPHDDTVIYDRICEADTIGLFQIESRAQISSLRMTQPRNLEDLAIQVALIRPGPIMAGAFHPFMETRQRAVRGEPVKIQYAHPCLEPVLKETLGVVIFQDQVLQIAMAAAGYSAGEAERLRRAMSRRRSREVMELEWPRFLRGCVDSHGMSPAVAEAIFKQLLAFAAFGFPKSHSVAFALLAYESAWLRHYYPAEYLAALLNSQPMGFYQPHVLIGDAQRNGLTVSPPTVNASGAQCTVESDATIRLGLDRITLISLETAKSIVAEREGNGPFGSLFDVVHRTRLKRDQIEALIKGRAFDEFGLRPRELLWQLGLFFIPRAAGQSQIDLPTSQSMVRLARPRPDERLREDYAQLGLSTELHPLALLRPKLAGLPTTHDLWQMKEGTSVELAGLVVCRQRPSTATGIVFELLEDEVGLANVVIYSNLYDREREVIRLTALVRVFGTIQWRGGSV